MSAQNIAAAAAFALLLSACQTDGPQSPHIDDGAQGSEAAGAVLEEKDHAREHALVDTAATPLRQSVESREAAAVGLTKRAELAAVAMAAVSRDRSGRIAPPPPSQPRPVGMEGYDALQENRFLSTALSPLATFGLDVDTASYANVRRFLSQGQLPPADAVRLEELLNYFDYPLSAPKSRDPLAVTLELGQAPWQPRHRLAMVALQARSIQSEQRPANRLVFLLDTSGSMNQANKLPLLKRAFSTLVEKMTVHDSVAIVTYAGSDGLVLPPTPGSNKEAMYQALNQLRAGGSTAGGQGIELAYRVARQQFVDGANNRIILATDGDFNVGVNSHGGLVRMIEKQRDSGVFLTVLGFGGGNYQDGKMQQLAGHGNGSHHYIDTDLEARRVFGSKLLGTLYTVAKDVKLQIEWNPRKVAQYRLLGYENRQLHAEDFKDDKKDSGEVGAGHSVIALFELVPAGADDNEAEPLRYQATRQRTQPANEWGWVKLRHKAPNATQSTLREFAFRAQPCATQCSAAFRWATNVAEFGLLLGQSEHRANANWDRVLQAAAPLVANDPIREEFLALARQAKVVQSGLALNNHSTREEPQGGHY